MPRGQAFAHCSRQIMASKHWLLCPAPTSPGFVQTVADNFTIRGVHSTGRKGPVWEATASLAEDSRTDLELRMSSPPSPYSSIKGLKGWVCAWGRSKDMGFREPHLSWAEGKK